MSKPTLIDKYLSLAIIMLFYICLCLLPTHLFKVWRPSWAYHGGIFLDYWAPKLYASQLAIALLWFLTLAKKMVGAGWERSAVWPHFRLKKLTSYQWGIAIMLAILVAQQLFTPEPRAAAVWLITLLTGPVAFGIFLLQERKLLKEHLFPALLLSVSLQAFLGLYQAIFQEHLGGYWLLGQPHYAPYAPLATSQLSATLRYLPYGSTPHPNALAAWILIGISSLFMLNKKKITLILLPLFLATLLATEAMTAWVSLALLGAFFLIWRTPGPRRFLQTRYARLHSLPQLQKSLIVMAFILALQAFWLMVLPLSHGFLEKTGQNSSPSLERRLVLQQITLGTIQRQPLGQGLNQHLLAHENAWSDTPAWNYLQPVHNSLIALVADAGVCIILLLSIFLLLEYFSYSSYFLIILSVLPVFTLDHFIYSTVSGQFMMVILLVFFEFSKSKNQTYNS